MGIVRELRKAITTEESPEREFDYECQNCNSSLDRRYHVCPTCGGYRIDRADWELAER